MCQEGGTLPLTVSCRYPRHPDHAYTRIQESVYKNLFDWSQGDRARIQDFCQGRAPREWWPYMGWEWAIFDIRKHRFATFQDVYCHIMPESCWTTIQETPVSLLSALETREPAPSARVLPSQGWAPAPWIRALLSRQGNAQRTLWLVQSGCAGVNRAPVAPPQHLLVISNYSNKNYMGNSMTNHLGMFTMTT